MNAQTLLAAVVISQGGSGTPDFIDKPVSCPVDGPAVTAPASPPPPKEEESSKAKPAADDKVKEPSCSLNVPDMELAKIVRILADQTKTNIVLMAKSDSRLTIRLEDVPLRIMLRHICALSGLSILNVDDTYVLATDEQLKTGYPDEWAKAHPGKAEQRPETVTRTVTLNHVKADQMAKALSSMYPPELLTVVVGPEQKSPSIEDQKIKLTDSNAAALGGGQGERGIQAGAIEERSNARAILLRGPKDVVDSAMDAVAKFDVGRAQVSIAVTVHEVTNEAVKELGLGWSFSNIVVQDRRVATNSGGSSSSTSVAKGGAFDPFSATATVKALETANKARLLASPTISVLDGERGYVLIGDRIKYPVVATFSQANTPVFDVREDRVGIYLQVAANVTENKDVTLSLYPQVSTITGFLNVNGASYPQISTREAQTTIRVKSGQTVFMAGLLRDDQVDRLDKVPILGDIPILGELFKLRKKSKTGTQLMITITPIVIEVDKP